MCDNCGCNVNIFDYEGEDDPDFDESKADRNKDGKISDWEKSVGNAVAKSMREQKEKKSAEGHHPYRLPQEYSQFNGYMVGMEGWEAVKKKPFGGWGVKLNNSRTKLVNGYNMVESDARLLAAAPELLAENLRLKQKVRGLDTQFGADYVKDSDGEIQMFLDDEEYKALKSASDVVREMRDTSLFGEQKERYLHETVGEGLHVIIREENQKRRTPPFRMEAESFGAEDVIDRYDIDMYSLMTLMAFQDPTDLSVVKQSINEMSCDRDTVRWAINWWEEAWGGVPEETLNYLGLNYDDYNAEDFDNKSNPIKKYCIGCGTPRKLEKLPYQVGIDGTQAYSCGDCYEDVREAEEFGAERECNVCDYTDSQGKPHPFCDKCRNHKGSCCRCVGSSDWEEMQQEFESDFSKKEMLDLKKYIDFPMRWINKNIRPTSDSKERKATQKLKGIIPAKRSPDSFRKKIDTPTWFKAVQLGIVAGAVGLAFKSDKGAIEQTEEQKEE